MQAMDKTNVTAATEKTSANTLPDRLKSFARGQFQQLLALGGLILIFAFFSLASPYFLTMGNVMSILLSAVVIGTLAIGTTFVIVSAGIDLSLGTGMSLCAVMAGVFITYWGLPVVVGVVLTIAFGGLMGLVNGLNTTVLKIPSFIATLAMMLIAEGLALVISGSSPIYFGSTPGYYLLSNGTILPWLPVPNAVLIWLGVAIAAGIVLKKTVFGRYAYAIGSNEEATQLSGVNTERWRLAIFTVGGAFTGLAGVLISARLNSAQPALGMGYELQAIAAVVIGGTSLFGGVGSIGGTVIGVLIMTVLTNGLQIMSVPQEWQTVILGVVIIAAVYFDNLRRRAAA